MFLKNFNLFFVRYGRGIRVYSLVVFGYRRHTIYTTCGNIPLNDTLRLNEFNISLICALIVSTVLHFDQERKI